MPSWPSRLLSSGSSTSSTPPLSSNEPQNTNVFPRSRHGDFHSAATPIHEIPTLHPLPSGEPPSSSSVAHRPRHGRSISHPFPSLFGNGKRTDRRVDLDDLEAELDALDDNTGLVVGRDITRTSSQKDASQRPEGDLMVGKCATCDSMVRWPRHLDVYRCSVCLMINDLKLAAKGAVNTRVENTVNKTEAFSSHKIPRKVLPLSVERTQSLIDECVASYLRSRHELLQDHDNLVRNNPVGGRNHSAPALTKTDSQRLGTDESVSDSPASINSVAAHIAEGSGRHASRYENSGLLCPSMPQNRKGSFDNGSPSRPPTARARSSNSIQAGHQHTSSNGYVRNDPRSILAKHIFRPLENYLVACLNDCECLNASFSSFRPSCQVRAASETIAFSERPKRADILEDSDLNISGMDAKTLLLGDFAENGMWWMGDRRVPAKKSAKEHDGANNIRDRKKPYIDWNSLSNWYSTIFSCGTYWRSQWRSLYSITDDKTHMCFEEQEIEDVIAQARTHVQRTFLKSVESLLRRPGRPLKSLEHCRFLLILLANPLLHPQPINHSAPTVSKGVTQETDIKPRPLLKSALSTRGAPSQRNNEVRSAATGQHSGIIKRILGLMANLPNECHQTLVLWFCRYSEAQFRTIVEMVGGFVSYRLNRQYGRKHTNSHDPTSDLIPDISGLGAGTSAHLHAALAPTGTPKQSETKHSTVPYAEDWQIKAAAKVMSILFSANNSGRFPRAQTLSTSPEARLDEVNAAAQQRAQNHTQLLPTNAFYNTLLDYADLIADFESWESRRGKFSFCQYPMFLSIWAKIRIMEHDAHRQMEIKAREAFFNSILSRKAVNQHLQLKVRRDCLVDDSLRAVSEVVGAGQEEIKKGLRIEFTGEEGVDAGGLRKEWFLLLVREVFDPEYGLFSYDEDSHYCYFNSNSLETSDQFFLVGVVFGLAIYNSTILDVALPPFAFRKLLASAPAYTGPTTSSVRATGGYTLEDLATWRPSLARGLQQLLEYEGNVEKTFCRDFVADVDRYGQIVQVPLCSNGENRTVTNSNRHEFVDLYIHYLLDTAVVRQYEPFKRGFFTVCGGNALSLFRPEEIELLVRGSDESLDVLSIQAVAIYENWKSARPEEDPTVIWFWQAFAEAEVRAQRKILGFITGSDRIPAMGATNLIIKIVCLGDHPERFPTARTCFNMLGLYRYRSYTEVKSKLWRAVLESEGFGLK